MMSAPSALPLVHVRDPLEERLRELLPDEEVEPRPIHDAMRYAVLGGGKRLRPRLAMAVAKACGADVDGLDLATRAGCAIEFVHCASLVHDDLPCFDDASVRRGRHTVHVVYGEPMAVLVGDALLTRAFEVLAEVEPPQAARAVEILRLLGEATGSRAGIIGGQSTELHEVPIDSGVMVQAGDSTIALERYHRMKTAALFEAAAGAGAIAAGVTDVRGWMETGACVGLAYQLLDDLGDVGGSAEVLGKAAGRDAVLGRPNAALALGESEARTRFDRLLARAAELVTSLARQPDPLLGLLDALRAHLVRVAR